MEGQLRPEGLAVGAGHELWSLGCDVNRARSMSKRISSISLHLFSLISPILTDSSAMLIYSTQLPLSPTKLPHSKLHVSVFKHHQVSLNKHASGSCELIYKDLYFKTRLRIHLAITDSSPVSRIPLLPEVSCARSNRLRRARNRKRMEHSAPPSRNSPRPP